MKVMSFNTQHCLNYIERKIDYKLMADTILQCGADIVGLQEMRGRGDTADYEEQTAILADLTGLKYHFFAKAIGVEGKNPYGNGFLSRYPIRRAEIIAIPDPDPKKYNEYYETRCLLKVELENGVTVLISHFGLNPDEQENAVQTVLQHISDEKCILMGDFNVTPDAPVLLPIRERMKDTAEVFEAELFSFPSDKPNIKIDYIFVSTDIEIVSADIPAIVASDHRPHTAEANISGI